MSHKKRYDALMKKTTFCHPIPCILKALTVLPLLLAAVAFAPSPGHAQTVTAATSGKPWVSTWGTSMAGTTAAGFAKQTYNGTNVFNDQTIRMIVHTSVGGKQVRVRLSNEFGTTAVVIGAAHIALSDTGIATVAGSDHVLTFGGGNATVTIPPGSPVVSDAVAMDVPALGNLAVSLYVPTETALDTVHTYAIQDNYVSPVGSGDMTATAVLPLDATTPSIQVWSLLSGVEVRARNTGTFVALGSSVTDGYLSTVDANHRWPDFLARRLNRHGLRVSTVNASLIANPLYQGPVSALARFDRDVLARPGVAYVFMNDILAIEFGEPADGTDDAAASDQMISVLRQYTERAHEYGIKSYAGTVLPSRGSNQYTDSYEARRQSINAFIRGGGFDGYADFDAAVRDPADPTRILPVYDGGDHHHLNDAGYKAVANTFDLALFQ